MTQTDLFFDNISNKKNLFSFTTHNFMIEQLKLEKEEDNRFIPSKSERKKLILQYKNYSYLLAINLYSFASSYVPINRQ